MFHRLSHHGSGLDRLLRNAEIASAIQRRHPIRPSAHTECNAQQTVCSSRQHFQGYDLSSSNPDAILKFVRMVSVSVQPIREIQLHHFEVLLYSWNFISPLVKGMRSAAGTKQD